MGAGEGWADLSLCVRREVQGGDSSQSPHPWRCLRMWHCALGWVTRWGSPTAWALIVLWFLHSFITHSLVISGVFSSLIVLSFLYSFITHSLGSNCSVIPSFLHHFTAWSSLGSDHSVIPSLPLRCDAEWWCRPCCPSRELRISSSQRGLKCSKKMGLGVWELRGQPMACGSCPCPCCHLFLHPVCSLAFFCVCCEEVLLQGLL